MRTDNWEEEVEKSIRITAEKRGAIIPYVCAKTMMMSVHYIIYLEWVSILHVVLVDGYILFN